MVDELQSAPGDEGMLPSSAAPSGGGPRTHAGLADFDPWAELPHRGFTLWPWGLDGVKEILDVAAIALIMFIGVRFAAHNYVVDGGSMLPTFEDGQFLIVNRLAYRSFDLSWVPFIEGREVSFGAPDPGDVVVFRYNNGDRDFIKRVIAVPGQTVEIHDRLVWVDGVALDEDYIAAPPMYDYPSTTVPEGMLFVLGDNRNNSFDSSRFGLVDAHAIIGRADLRYWPLGTMGRVGHAFGEPVGATEVQGSQ